MATVNCIGVMVVDALGGPIPHWPVPKKVTQVLAPTLTFLPGGGAANSAAALAQLRTDVAAFSKVGEDANGAFLIRELQRHGVQTEGIRVSADDMTPFTYVGIHSDGDRTFVHTPGANLTFSPSDVDRECLLDCRFLLVQDYWVLPKWCGKPYSDLLRDAKERGVITLLDECWGLGPERATWEMAVAHADYVLPSMDDLAVIYPDLSATAVCEQLAGCGAGIVVLKLGADGVLLRDADGFCEVPSVARDIVDTTGAGDCFDAGFIAGLARGLSPRESAAVGAKAAAACIRHVGGAAGIPPLAELMA